MLGHHIQVAGGGVEKQSVGVVTVSVVNGLREKSFPPALPRGNRGSDMKIETGG